MKKFQLALMCFATLAFVACKENNKPNSPNDEDEDEYVAPIVIDGDATEWNALGDKVYTVTCNANSEFKALTTMKVYSDELFIYLYAEYDASLIDINEDMSNDEFAQKWGVPFHIYLNASKSENGFVGTQWSTPATLLTEGFLFLEGNPIEYAPSAFTWAGAEASDEWSWETSSAQGFVTASKVTSKTIEMSILREALPETIGDEFFIGIDIQKNWDSQGILPNMEKNEEGTLAPMLLVKTDK